MNIIKEKSFQDLKYWQLGSNRFGKPQMYVHSFLLDGLLIDTGQPLVGNDFVKILEKEKIDKIILTHHHEDHSGNVEAIKQLKKVLAFAAPKCCEIMKNPPLVEPARWVTWGQMKKTNLIPLDLKKNIETENFSFQILETPGHAIDQISLFEPNKGWLFSGDLFVHNYVKVFMRPENIGQQITSIKKLLKLNFDILLCNHQPIFKNGKGRLKMKLDFLEDFYRKVEREYEKGNSVKEIMKKLGLKEDWFMVLFGFGQLSKKNMVKSVIRSIEANKKAATN